MTASINLFDFSNQISIKSVSIESKGLVRTVELEVTASYRKNATVAIIQSAYFNTVNTCRNAASAAWAIIVLQTTSNLNEILLIMLYNFFHSDIYSSFRSSLALAHSQLDIICYDEEITWPWSNDDYGRLYFKSGVSDDK